MSIVINVFSGTSSWIASDGLQLDTATGRIVRTDLQKYEILNPHLCIGYTGCYEHARRIVDYLKQLCPNIDQAYADLAAQCTKALLDEATRQVKGFDAQFVLTGTIQSGQLVSYTVKNGQGIKLFACKPDEYMFIILHNHCTGNLGQMIQRRSQDGNITENAILAGIHDLIRDTARYDRSVNTHMTFHRIDAQ